MAAASQSQVEGHGLRVDLPDGWSARIFRSQPEPPEMCGPSLHVGNFGIPLDPANRGTTLIQSVTPGRLAIIYNESVPDHIIRPGQDAFAPDGLPTLTTDAFREDQVLAGVPGQTGVQYFFTTRGQRPGILAAVIGVPDSGIDDLVAQANAVLDGLQFASAPEQRDFAHVPRHQR